MRVVNNICRQAIKKVSYGTAVRLQGPGKNNDDDLYIVVDFFVGDKSVRLVNLATGVVIKIPEDDEVLLVEHAYVEVENPNGYI